MSYSFTLVINSGNLSNPNTNGTYTYNFIGGGFTIDNDMEVMLSSAQIPYSIFNITSAYNNNKFTLAFPTGAAAGSYTNFNITIPDGFYTIEDFNTYMQQFAITNGLYLIDANGNNVYYYAFMLINHHILFKFYYIPFLDLFLLDGRSLQTG